MGAGCTRGATATPPVPPVQVLSDDTKKNVESASSSRSDGHGGHGGHGHGGAHKGAADGVPRPGSYREESTKASGKQHKKPGVSLAPLTVAPAIAASPPAPNVAALGTPSLPGVVSPRAAEAASGLRGAAEVRRPEAVDKPDAVVVRAGVRPTSRSYSLKSEEALSALSHIAHRLKQIEDRVAELDESVRKPGCVLTKAKTELAALEAEAGKLESCGVDSVYTGELLSGKDSAKETKKEQLRRLEALFKRIDEVFSAISQHGSSSTTIGSGTAPSDRSPKASTPPCTPQFAIEPEPANETSELTDIVE